tara:strand:+ start:2543 stop:3148 length:606 start_codon:yes stop_codon:yes gene_type:complete
METYHVDTINHILAIWNDYIKPNLSNINIKIDINYDTSCFIDILKEAEKGNLLNWLDTKNGFIAYIVLMLYISKNIYHGKKYNKNDYKAILFMEMGFENYINNFDVFELITILSPYMYSENITYLNNASNILNNTIKSNINISMNHLNIVKKYLFKLKKNIDTIKKFNRLPEMNYILERVSTEEEIDYLDTDDQFNRLYYI